MQISGGCLCTSVRYQFSAAPLMSRVCWCRVCQYIGAGSGTVNVCFPKDALSLTGELRDYRNTADSGNVMHRRFCPACGTHLFSEAESRPHLIFVRAGTLDDPELIKPSATVWTSAAPSWACFDAKIERIESQPSPVR